jgi:hypothetical protein
MTQTPNPGSAEAVKAGCLCPVMDNHFGRGYRGGSFKDEHGEPLFIFSGDCPLHCKGKETP